MLSPNVLRQQKVNPSGAQLDKHWFKNLMLNLLSLPDIALKSKTLVSLFYHTLLISAKSSKFK